MADVEPAASISNEESLTLPCHPTAPRAARRMARRVAPPGTADTVELLVSELVTNAVLHGGSEVQLTIANRGDRVRVEVSDSSPCLPQIVHTDMGAHGRGLQLVDALATRWGSEPTVTGKMVWCEVSPETSGLLPRIAGSFGSLTPVR